MHLQPKTSMEDVQEISSKERPLFLTKKRLTRLLVGESQSVHVETEKILKKFLGLVPEEEEPKRIKGEDLPDTLNLNDIIPYEIMFDDTLVDVGIEKEMVIITDEETVLSKAAPTSKVAEMIEQLVNEQTYNVQIIAPPVKGRRRKR